MIIWLLSVRRRTSSSIQLSPSGQSSSSMELADEATTIDGSSPTSSLPRSAASAFKAYQRSASAQETRSLSSQSSLGAVGGQNVSPSRTKDKDISVSGASAVSKKGSSHSIKAKGSLNSHDNESLKDSPHFFVGSPPDSKNTPKPAPSQTQKNPKR